MHCRSPCVFKHIVNILRALHNRTATLFCHSALDKPAPDTDPGSSGMTDFSLLVISTPHMSFRPEGEILVPSEGRDLKAYPADLKVWTTFVILKIHPSPPFSKVGIKRSVFFKGLILSINTLLAPIQLRLMSKFSFYINALFVIQSMTFF